MMSWLRRLFRSRGLAINLIASACFVFLAVYGWGLTWGEVIDFLIAIILLIGILMVIAFGVAWLLRFFKSK